MTGYVYRTFDAEGRLLYVGTTVRPVQRLNDHEHVSRWWRETANITVEQFPTREAAFAAEALAIRRERPLHNVLGNGSRRVAKDLRDPIRVARAELALTETVGGYRAREIALTEELAEIVVTRDAAIRQARVEGVTHRRIAEIVGLSPQRVDQITRGARL